MTRTEIIIQFIEKQFLIEFGDDITPQSDLFKEGVIDSFGYIHLMSFLEREFAFTSESAEFLLAVPTTLEAIDRFVAERADGKGTQQAGAPCAE
ncbi:acyl carrier protein [Streptomyces paludis]|uniref:Acyl carrier protein n=1 Tax=Streptomyces paludis TaxID=2282738 RepID=A0A345HZ13_9ACTN|nr:acyl carrier protein [Streptomyces paludis]AXG81937.1 acyl carrier protein [Streptomyces paludis]